MSAVACPSGDEGIDGDPVARGLEGWGRAPGALPAAALTLPFSEWHLALLITIDRARQLAPLAEAQLAIGIGDMILDGAMADEDPVADLAAREPTGGESKHVRLTFGQEIQPAPHHLRPPVICEPQGVAIAPAQVRLSGPYRLDGGPELRIRCVRVHQPSRPLR
jgi:hypothetical protein